MSQGTPLLRFIKGMTLDELNSICRRCDWCNVRAYNDKADLAKRVRDSIKRSVDSGALTYSEAMQDIRLQVLIPRPETIETVVRQTLYEAPITDPTGDVRLIEEWFSAQLYGALSAKVHEPYEVYLEYEVNNRSRHQADVYIKNTEGEGDILIEVKREGEINNGEAVKRQIQRYRRHISARSDLNHQMTYLCIITEKDTSEWNPEKMFLSDYLEVPDTLDNIESDLNDTELVITAIE
ncbi:hypothetical protein GRS48_04495 [Halorubrum sp. JWXQ-INN 858]|uniref:hypothetical protein n=1 Tax=Halorubrum sp. JWXQ-INN 858 TaxID=2690782 RepID=UPI001358C799|nr:hypothetical protein [Halorubrum sp. JWXQ-INN 858]MWV64086.1 hypothetical protein [Halorubrum sp. JWXQ-INN 858]